MNTRRNAFILVASLALVVGGCQTGRQLVVGEADDPFRSSDRAGDITIFVENNVFSEATVTAVTGVGRRRLGRVGGNRRENFTMALTMATDLQLELDFLAGPTCITDRMSVAPGDALQLTIRSDYSNLYCGEQASPLSLAHPPTAGS